MIEQECFLPMTSLTDKEAKTVWNSSDDANDHTDAEETVEGSKKPDMERKRETAIRG